MVGIGVTPEGIHNSYPMYDLMLENGWRQRPVEDVDKWFRMFSRRRYGNLNSGHAETAWKMVRKRETLDFPNKDQNAMIVPEIYESQSPSWW